MGQGPALRRRRGGGYNPGTMTAKILLVAQRETSDPGRVGEAFQALGYDLDIRRPAKGDPLPANGDEHAGAVIFGGPMSANDDHLPFIRAELDWIPRWLETGKPYLGICLGAQLLARTLGARVSPHPEGWHEIGFYRVTPTPAGADLFAPPFHAYQWHGEGFDLPQGATLLAEGEKFTNQAYRVGQQAYGLQFHPEVRLATVERWMRVAGHRLVLPGACPREKQRQDWALHEPAVEQWLRRFLPRWLKSGT
jgi:GMP synthase (glutamine-hydrolysing)